MFIKHSTGKITSVIEEDELDEQQKKAISSAVKTMTVQPAQLGPVENKTDVLKKLGND